MMERNDLGRIIDHGFQYGHNLNPMYPELQETTVDQLVAAGQEDRLTKQMIASVQASDGALRDLVAEEHNGRALAIDGDPGPATLRLIDIPRCGHPDFEMAAEEEQAGSWLKGCVEDFPGIYAIIMGLERSRMQSAWRDNLEVILRNITAAQNEVGQHPIWKFDRTGFANQKINWISMPGGIIGRNAVPRSFSCPLSVSGTIDTTWSPYGSDLAKRIRYLCRLGMHEWFGHGNGTGHYSSSPGRPSIMNPSITDGAISWKGDRLYDKMIGFFDGPINPDPGGSLQDWGTSDWL